MITVVTIGLIVLPVVGLFLGFLISMIIKTYSDEKLQLPTHSSHSQLPPSNSSPSPMKSSPGEVIKKLMGYEYNGDNGAPDYNGDDEDSDSSIELNRVFGLSLIEEA